MSKLFSPHDKEHENDIPMAKPDDKHEHEHKLSPEVQAINRLTEEIKAGFEWFKSHSGLVTKQDLKETERKLMSAISEFAAKQAAFNTQVSTAIDGAVASVTGLTEDIQTLNDKITELQNSTGQITPEDQASLDSLQTAGQELATKAEAVASALASLDALTPPKPPVA